MPHPYPATPAATCSAVVGLQWGDEGKGKIVDILAAEHDAVVRYNGGANAGHSVVVKGDRYALHLIPSGILYPGKLAVIGNGVVVDPQKLIDELDGLAKRGVDTSGLVVSNRAHVVMPYHKAEDGMREDLLKSLGQKREAVGEADTGSVASIGTTRRGIGPAYADKVQRATAVRMGDLLKPDAVESIATVALAIKSPVFRELGTQLTDEMSVQGVVKSCRVWGERLRPMIKDTTYLLHDLLASGKRILFEGANGTLLDVDHGTYPYVTGSTTALAGIGVGAGVPPQRVGRSLGVMKAYSTRVGGGPMPTELTNATGDLIRTRGREFGTTTGRPRRVGWLDLVATRYAAMINGVTGLALTMLDVLGGFDELQVCTGYKVRGEIVRQFLPDASELARAEPVYERLDGFPDTLGGIRRLSDLPPAARRYVDFIEKYVEVPAAIVSVGPDREQTMMVA
jgi:adenylosuccinate synthase